MVCYRNFFVKILAELYDPQVAIVLTPQKFHNYDPECDIFNHSNLIYWQVSLPGLDGWDNVSCTGTNFVIRARAAQEVLRLLKSTWLLQLLNCPLHKKQIILKQAKSFILLHLTWSFCRLRTKVSEQICSALKCLKIWGVSMNVWGHYSVPQCMHCDLLKLLHTADNSTDLLSQTCPWSLP